MEQTVEQVTFDKAQEKIQELIADGWKVTQLVSEGFSTGYGQTKGSRVLILAERESYVDFTRDVTSDESYLEYQSGKYPVKDRSIDEYSKEVDRKLDKVSWSERIKAARAIVNGDDHYDCDDLFAGL